MKEYPVIIYRILGAVVLMSCLFGNHISAQFQGGVADGQAGISIAASISNPVYCLGGQGDGQAQLVESSTISPGVYCLGGNSDGHASLYSFVTISEPVYITGGNGDGMAFTGTNSIISTPFYCFGGNADGFGLTDAQGLTNGIAVYCYGGNEDGFGLTGCQGLTNGVAVYCFGGSEDGSGITSAGGTIPSPIYCLGGAGDGTDLTWSPEFFLGDGNWTGYVSHHWESPGNWTNNSIPGDNAAVAIPGGCLHYPILNSSFSINDPQYGDVNCSGLTIRNGASFTSSGMVRVNGTLSIAGQYNHTNSNPTSFQVTGQGEVTVNPGGSLLIQP